MSKPPNLKLISPLEAVSTKIDYFDNLTDTDLTLAVMSFIGRASHRQLRDLITQASLRLTNPCTELCDKDCFEDENN